MRGCTESYDPPTFPKPEPNRRRRHLSSYSRRRNHQTLAADMPISVTETRMPSHRRRYKGPSEGSRCVHRRSPARAADPSHRKPSPAMRISSTETEAEIPCHGRSKRPSPTLSFDDDSASYPTWMILNRVGARRDSFHGDGTTPAVSYTSGGEQVSVSFDLAKPPRTCLLTLDWPQGPRPSEGTTSYPHVVAAHGNVVLLEIISAAKYPHPAAVDYFVYNAKASGEPSLTRLPVCYWKGTSDRERPRPRIMSRVATGILSCRKDSFVVAELARRSHQPSAANIYLLCPWRVFRDVPICHGNGIGWVE